MIDRPTAHRPIDQPTTGSFSSSIVSFSSQFSLFYQVKSELIFDSSRDTRAGSMSSVSSLPANLAGSTCASLLAANATTIAGAPVLTSTAAAGAVEQQHHSASSGTTTTTTTTTTSKKTSSECTPVDTPSGSRRSSLKPSSIRESFRKLVRPKVKKREPAADGEDDDSLNSLPRDSLSRRGSRLSNLPEATTTTTTTNRPEVNSKWKKILGVSLAISR